MREPKERTPFGDRLFRARSHAKLTQPQLAKAAGMAQSTLGELEWIGHGSSKTAQLARACGVRVEWLAEGDEPMVTSAQNLPPEIAELAGSIALLPPELQADVLTGVRNLLHLAQVAAAQQEETPNTKVGVGNTPSVARVTASR